MKTRNRCAAFLLAVCFMLGVAGPARALSEPVINAPRAIVIDGDTGEVLYSKNGESAQPAASMTKLMSMYLMYEEMAQGRLTFQTPIPATKKAVAISNDRSYSGLERLKSGQSYSLESLMEIIITASCNGAVVAIAEHISGSEAAFVQRMNAKAAEWGIDARFADCTGIISRGNAVSPHAMAEIARRLITDYPDILRMSAIRSTEFQGKTFTTSNRLLKDGAYPGIDGLKSGWTSSAGQCFTGTASRDGRRVITVVMGSANATTRTSDTRSLLDYGFGRQLDADPARLHDIRNTRIQLSAGEGAVYPFSAHTFTARFAGMSQPYWCRAQWFVSGVPASEPADFWTGSPQGLSLTVPVPAAARSMTVGLRLTLANGEELYQESIFTVSSQPLTFSGVMGARELAARPGVPVRVPCTVRCDQAASVTVPAAWFLNGKEIPGYRNNAFAMEPERTSSYAFQSKQPGEYVLSFVCNPDNLPGVERTEFQTVIRVLP